MNKQVKAFQYILNKHLSRFNLELEELKEIENWYNKIFISKHQLQNDFLFAIKHLKNVLHKTQKEATLTAIELFSKYGAVPIEKPIILCLIGESGSGKTYVSKYMERVHLIPMIRSYSTRSPRNENDNSHKFISNKEFDNINKDKMLAYVELPDEKQPDKTARYCSVDSDIIAGVMSYVIDPLAFRHFLASYSHDYTIYGIRVHSDEKSRSKGLYEGRKLRDEIMFKDEDMNYDFLLFNEYDDSIQIQVDEIINKITKDIGLK